MNVTEEILELAQKFVLCSKYYNKVLNIGLTFFNLIGYPAFFDFWERNSAVSDVESIFLSTIIVMWLIFTK